VQVRELVDFASLHWTDLGLPLPSPAFTLDSKTEFVETAELTLNSQLAASELGWSSSLDWRQSVTLTLDWYAAFGGGEHPSDLVKSQLEQYVFSLGGVQ
jgi:hypothetical protein